MKMADHTPGPWKVEPYVDGIDILDADGLPVASLADRPLDAQGLPPGNARLIAASPDLLEVCEDAPDPDQLGIAGVEAFAAHYREWYEQRRAAVLKALPDPLARRRDGE
jgi:hypothetical protein